ncbi:uncharacterized protein LOC129582175 [Paramacrobiotus metropolitanus]|uniref:uncharacterized protein LOC129582175 n=1 Tax=Paramacrobiotus metropolitanus TaxID=2943436 RepID=UPI002445EB6D|nr:uncharacterized protein LOC129582175 [Paramacrobiotus metropolitanus]
MLCGIYTANSVDVVGDDGLRRHGRVVDVTDDGFLVDFLSSAEGRRLLPFGSKIFSPDRYPSAKSTTTEVLMRQNSGDPWIWYTAEHLRKHYGVVVVQWVDKDKAVHTDIVPDERVRERDLSSRLTERDEFEKVSVQLPAWCGSVSAEELRDQLHIHAPDSGFAADYFAFSLVDVVDGRLWYVHLRNISEEMERIQEENSVKYQHEPSRRFMKWLTGLLRAPASSVSVAEVESDSAHTDG